MSIRILLVLALACPLFSADEKAAAKEEPSLKDQKVQNSYAVGMQMGGKLKGASLDLDAELVAQGVKDAMTGASTLLTEMEMNAALKSLQADYRAKQGQAVQRVAEKNKKDGEAFLATNKTKEGVVTLESGLQYKILKEGTGKKPNSADTVICYYRGSFIDGRELDNNYKRNKPATFPLKSVIPGWSEALQLMPVGSKWQLFIPSTLAYGESGQRGRGGRGSVIGPNTALIFEVELVKIQDTPSPAAAKAEIDKTDLKFSFKLDPRLTKAMYMGERWVSPPTYTTTSETIEVRAQALDSKGMPAKTDIKWTSSDPEMVTLSRNEGNDVEIHVKHAGESSLEVASNGISKRLSLKAKQMGQEIQVEISQRQQSTQTVSGGEDD